MSYEIDDQDAAAHLLTDPGNEILYVLTVNDLKAHLNARNDSIWEALTDVEQKELIAAVRQGCIGNVGDWHRVFRVAIAKWWDRGLSP